VGRKNGLNDKHAFTLWVSMNFYPYSPYLLADLGEIWYKGTPRFPLNSCEFRENRIKEGHTCLTHMNEITCTRVT